MSQDEQLVLARSSRGVLYTGRAASPLPGPPFLSISRRAFARTREWVLHTQNFHALPVFAALFRYRPEESTCERLLGRSPLASSRALSAITKLSAASIIQTNCFAYAGIVERTLSSPAAFSGASPF